MALAQRLMPNKVVDLDERMEGVTKSKPDGPPPAKKKRMSVERLYQKKSQHEHILLRPDTYIGSVEEITQTMWVYDEGIGMNFREVTYVPGLYKIFDEILVNAADNKQRDPKMNLIKINIDVENNKISIWNNGRGIPVEMHKDEKMYVPTMIFGHLLTSSNYDDEEQKVTGGRNGFGAKLCNIYSTEFTVETAHSDSGRKFKQVWKNNMLKTNEPKISPSSDDFTCITFKPDLSKFKMESLTKDTVALLTRRAYDVAGTSRVRVMLNGTALKVRSFRDYVNLYLDSRKHNDEQADDGAVGATKPADRVVHEVINDRWEICVTVSSRGFQHVSFANSIATTKGGTHVTYIADQVVAQVQAAVAKKNKGGVTIKPFQIKNHVWVFINALIVNPSFDSQTKEFMTLKSGKFGSKCQLNEGFTKRLLRCGIVENVLEWARFKSQSQLKSKCHSTKHSKLRGIAKLDDANNAGTKHSRDCTLILTEGDSAKALAISGLSVVGRDNYGVFPLRGKLLNVREASHKQIMDNAELTNLVKILGLQYQKDYSKPGAMDSLRYGHLMIMTDQDQDGSHIKGLLINFIHYNWPSLVRQPNFLVEFITPIVKVTKGKNELSFYSMPEFEQWKAVTDNVKSWKVKYYKGLGTSTHKEAKEYFSGMDRHRIPFCYTGREDDESILLAFSKKKAAERREWLDNWLQTRRDKRAEGMQESFLYGSTMDNLTYQDFVNKELVLFSNMDNERSIPSLVDGLKPGQRKVLFTCFKRNDKRDIKVAQLAGSVAELSAYHHGEASLMGTIIGMAQDYVGSNNLNLLQPLGQFGTRLQGGKDAASPRYIFTMLSTLTRKLFPTADEANLHFLQEDNQRIEPEWYCPIIPLVLVNGADGIGTGYSTTVPNYDVRDVVRQMRRMMQGHEPELIAPSYRGFTGTIAHVEPTRYAMYGTIRRLGDTELEITELPVRVWTQVYKENVLVPLLHGTEKSASFITDYREYHTEATVRFVVSLTPANMAKAEQEGFYKKFKLESRLNTSNLVLFDSGNCLRRYNNVCEILREFFDLRLHRYDLRKRFLVGQLAAEVSRLENQARFITEKNAGRLVIENKRKADLIALLQKQGYASDPVKAWTASRNKAGEEDEDGAGDSSDEEDAEDSTGPDYNYLLGMSLWSLTKEKTDELLRSRDKKKDELELLKSKTPKDLWNSDLDDFMEELVRVETKEREDASVSHVIASKKKSKTGGRSAKTAASAALKEAATQPMGEIIPPIVPTFSDVVEKVPKKRKVAKKDGAGDGEEVDGNDGAALAGAEKPADKPAAPKSLAERLAQKTTRPKTTKPKTVVLDSESDDEEMEVDDAPPVERPKRTTRPTKPTSRNPWSDDDEEDDEDDIVDDDDDAWSEGGGGGVGDSDDDFSMEISAPKPSRSRPGKTASKPAKQPILSDDESEPESLPAVSKPKAVAKEVVPKQTTTKSTAESKKKPAAAAKKAPKAKPTTKRNPWSDDEDEEDDDDDMLSDAGDDSDEDYEMPAPKPSRSRGARKTGSKPAKQPVQSDDESEPELPPAVSKPKAVAEVAPKQTATKSTAESKKKPAAAAKKAPKAKPTTKRNPWSDDEDEEDDDDDMLSDAGDDSDEDYEMPAPKPSRSRGVRKTGSKPAKQPVQSDDESEPESPPAVSKPKAVAVVVLKQTATKSTAESKKKPAAAAKKAPKAKPTTKRNPWSDDEDEEDDDDDMLSDAGDDSDEDYEMPAPKPSRSRGARKTGSKPAKQPVQSDDESELESPPVVTKPKSPAKEAAPKQTATKSTVAAKKKPAAEAKKAAKAKSTKIELVSASDDDYGGDNFFADGGDVSDDSFTVAPPKPKGRAKASKPAKKPAAAKKVNDDVMVIDSDDEAPKPKVTAKKSTARKPAAKKATGEKAAAKPKAAVSKPTKRKRAESFSDMSDAEISSMPVPDSSPMSRAKRSRAPVKYMLDDSDDSDF